MMSVLMLLLELYFKVMSIVKFRSLCLIKKYICISYFITWFCNDFLILIATQNDIFALTFTWAECYRMCICFYIWGKTRSSFLGTRFWINYEKLTWYTLEVVESYFKFCRKLLNYHYCLKLWNVGFFLLQNELCGLEFLLECICMANPHLIKSSTIHSSYWNIFYLLNLVLFILSLPVIRIAENQYEKYLTCNDFCLLLKNEVVGLLPCFMQLYVKTVLLLLLLLLNFRDFIIQES
jgi:hypothetical protein